MKKLIKKKEDIGRWLWWSWKCHSL